MSSPAERSSGPRRNSPGAPCPGPLADESVRFAARDDAGPPVDGIVAVALHAVDRDRVGEEHDICGVRLELV